MCVKCTVIMCMAACGYHAHHMQICTHFWYSTTITKLGASDHCWVFDSHRIPWWRCRMETFSALLALCDRNSPVTGEFPSQRPVARSFDSFFDLRLNKWLSKQSWGWWFDTPSRSLWRHCNDKLTCHDVFMFWGVVFVWKNSDSDFNKKKKSY